MLFFLLISVFDGTSIYNKYLNQKHSLTLGKHCMKWVSGRNFGSHPIREITTLP